MRQRSQNEFGPCFGSALDYAPNYNVAILRALRWLGILQSGRSAWTVLGCEVCLFGFSFDYIAADSLPRFSSLTSLVLLLGG